MKLDVGGIAMELRAPTSVRLQNYVMATWLRSYRDVFDAVPKDRMQAWFDGQRRVATRLLGMTHVLVRPSEPETAHAWVCGREGVCHYVYVPPQLRRKGIAKAVVQRVCGDGGVHTHRKPSYLRSAFAPWHYDFFALVDDNVAAERLSA